MKELNTRENQMFITESTTETDSGESFHEEDKKIDILHINYWKKSLFANVNQRMRL
jgi:hypothetical protein